MTGQRTLTAAELAQRAGMTATELAAQTAPSDVRTAGPNRAQRRAAWRRAKKERQR